MTDRDQQRLDMIDQIAEYCGDHGRTHWIGCPCREREYERRGREVEALQTELVRIGGKLAGELANNAALAEEALALRERIARVEGAMRVVALACCGCDCEPHKDGSHEPDCQSISWVAQEARKALGTEHKP